MTILATDIKLLESQRMTDTTDGGGRMTGVEIPDNVAGNLFPKISRLDAVYGRVNLRKIFMQVQTANLDTYGGANMAIVDPPANGKVSVLLFSTGSDFDTRSDAQNRIEGYVIKGVLSRMKLFGDQIVGQKSILVYQKTSEPLPEIGEVYLLSVEKTGYTPAEQYVRITDLKYEDRTFTVTVSSGGEVTFTRRVLTLGIGYPLVQTFPGAEVSAYEDTGSPTVVRETNVADTARYFGVQPFGGAYPAGAFTVKASSLYAPIVPSTNRETAVSMAQVGEAGQYAPIADQQTLPNYWGNAQLSTAKIYLMRSPIPRTLTIQRDGGAAPDWPKSDDGAGALWTAGGGSAGSVDYGIGSIAPAGVTWSNNHLIIGLQYGAPVQQPPHTQSLPITLATQGTVYSVVLSPIPAPGSLIVDYRALGRWYRLQDDGTGQVSDGSGTTTIGSGSISYVDGSLVLTLGALPDVGSSLLLAWGSPAHYERLNVTSPAIAGPALRGTLAISAPGKTIAPGSVSVTWGTGLTATADAKGTITGSAAGYINHQTGEWLLTPAVMPAPNTVFNWAYSEITPGASSPQTLTGTLNGTDMVLTGVGGGNLMPGTVSLSFGVWILGVQHQVTVYDDGNGNLMTGTYRPNGTQAICGSINYVTGDAVIHQDSATI